MILTEYLNNNTLVRHYSDQGRMLLQNETGIKYSNPIDIVPCPYTYTETADLLVNGDVPVTGDEFLLMLSEVL